MMKLTGCRVEHLRGYADTPLHFKAMNVLVGENNEGKSSVLKMVDAIMRCDDDLLMGRRKLTADENDFWVPANNAIHKARRLTLFLHVRDGRVARKYKGQDHEVQLRFSVAKSAHKVRVNCGRARVSEVADPLALELLKKLKENIDFVLIPAVRDASSSRFARGIAKKVDESIAAKLRPVGQAGTTREYRFAKGAITLLKKIVDANQDELALSKGLPILNYMTKSSSVRLQIDHESLIKYISQGLGLSLSTGEHDTLQVKPTEVGNGLQSIIDISLTVADAHERKKNLFLIVEEPESFLHPSAQRQLIQGLRDSVKAGDQVVLTTHSPIVIDEAGYPEITIVRKRRFYAPSDVGERRAAINSNLMCTPTAEIFFAGGVLLVEGAGDRALFRSILQRLRRLPEGAHLANLVVQDVGGSRSFSPWFSLLRSYGKEGDRPIRYFAVLDADAIENTDGDRPIVRGLRDAGIAVSPAAETLIHELAAMNYEDPAARLVKVDEVNRAIADIGVGLFSIDLEWAMVNGDATHIQPAVNSLFEQMGSDLRNDVRAQAKSLGSKVGNGTVVNRPRKEPFLRAQLAGSYPFRYLPIEVRGQLTGAMRTIMNDAQIHDLWAAADRLNPMALSS